MGKAISSADPGVNISLENGFPSGISFHGKKTSIRPSLGSGEPGQEKLKYISQNNQGRANWRAAGGIQKIIDIASMTSSTAGVGFTASYNNCTGSLVVDETVDGGEAIYCTHTASATSIYANFLLTSFPKTTVTRKELGVWIKFDDWSQVSILTIYAGVSGLATTDTTAVTITNNGDYQGNGWRFFSYYAAVPNTTSIVNLRVRIDTTGATSGVNFSIGPAYADISQTPTFSFSFDDGYLEHYTLAAPLLEAYGFRGTFSIIGEKIDTANYMTKSQLIDLVNRGHDLQVHGLSALNTFSSDEAAYADIKANYDYLVGIGVFPEVYVFPNGVLRSYKKDLDFLKTLGIKLARGVGNDAAGSTTLPMFFLNERPNYVEPRNMGWSVTVTGTPAQYLTNLDANVTRKSNSIGMFHQIDLSGATGQRINLADFETIVAGVRTRHDSGALKCMTVKELLNGYV
jgi:peptidoglycan/xylan/chitin deacetylase (PgdA/CDA1 family)